LVEPVAVDMVVDVHLLIRPVKQEQLTQVVEEAVPVLELVVQVEQEVQAS
jgi:two-component SAPR family response regulator